MAVKNNVRLSAQNTPQPHSMTRSIILKLASSRHRRQRVRTAEDFLEQRVIIQCIGRHVFRRVHVFACFQNLVAPLLHVVQLVREQLKSLLIRIG
jgi:hypothetical protein